MFLESIVKTVYATATIASSYFTLTDRANIGALFLWHRKCDYICCLPQEMAVYIQWGDCPALFEWVCCILRFFFFFFLVKVKNEPWEEHTSICWVHKRMCWQTLFGSERAAWGCACVRACAFSFYLSPACHLEAGQSRKKDKVAGGGGGASTTCMEKLTCRGVKRNVQRDATCRRMSFKNSMKQYVGLYLNTPVGVDG